MIAAASSSSSDARDRVVVVGAGVIGAACAYYLSRAGRSVVVVDQGEFGRGCSHANCGYVCPSHVLPLAYPGAAWAAIKTLFARNSPLKVRFRFDPAMWGWFARFAARCNRRDMLAGARAIQALLVSSRTLYDELIASELSDVEWSPTGLLFVFRTPHAFEHYAATDRLLRDEFDLAATRHDSAALQALEPALSPDVAGAWHYPGDASLRPDKLMRAWRRALEARGVEIRERCRIDDSRVSGSRVTSLVTDQGEIAGDQVVVATGAWTPRLAGMLRASLPIQPGKGYSLTMARPSICPRLPMIFEEHRVAVSPLRDAYRLGSTMEFAGYDETLNPSRLQLLRDAAKLYLREPLAEPVLEEWWGWRPMTPDSLPYVGPAPKLSNVFVAAGHGMLGVSMAPATGKLVAELALGERPHLDPTPYSLTRR